MTADRTGSQPLSPASPILATKARRSPTVLTQMAETVVRYGLPVFILCLPLEVTSVYLHLQLARIVLLVVAVAFVYLVVVGERKLVLPVGAAVIVLGLFVAVSVVSWLLTRAPGSGNSLLDVVAYPVVAVLVVNLARTEKEHEAAWAAFLASALAVALLGGFLYYTGLSLWRPDPAMLGRVNATFADPNITARFLTLAVAIAVFMFAGRRQKTWLVVSVALAGTAALPLTFSKSGFLIFPVTVVLAAALSSNWRRGAAIGLLALIVVGSAIMINPSTRDRSLVVLDSITGTTHGVVSSATSGSQAQPLGGVQLDSVRTYLILAGWQMFKDHPVAGVGLGGFQHALLTTYRSFLPPKPPPGLSMVTLSHTSAITILAEEGLAGVLLIVGFLLLLTRDVVRSLRRPTRWRDLVVTPAFLAVPILAYSQFEGRFVEEPYLWLALGLLYSALTMERSVRTVELP